uniref:Cyclin-dependent kinase inhibitor 1B n=1 Tax=Sparus aurata TaxID=8175 RepID=A0A671VHJ6_SPAAU
MCNKMSDVRLSNASPTVERVDARQQDNVRPPVRRSLFGSPDREEIRRYLDAAIQGEVQDFRERYNFDPVEERPLTPRNYEWQADDDAPEFYRRPPHGGQRVLVCTDHSPFHVLTVHPPCVPARGTSSTSDCFFQLHHSTGCFLFLSHRAGEDLSLVEYCSPFSSSDRWERKKINIYI